MYYVYLKQFFTHIHTFHDEMIYTHFSILLNIANLNLIFQSHKPKIKLRGFFFNYFINKT